MIITLFGVDFIITRAPKHKARTERPNFTVWHDMVAAMQVGDVLTWPNHDDSESCAIRDSLLKKAKQNGMKIKTAHKGGELIVRRIS